MLLTDVLISIFQSVEYVDRKVSVVSTKLLKFNADGSHSANSQPVSVLEIW